MVSSAPVCNRCRQVAASTGDSWCLTCSAWEALGRELSGHWDHIGCRTVAADLVTNCVRQVRALRSLGAGISRAPEERVLPSAPLAGESRAKSPREGRHRREELGDTRASLPRRRSGHRSAKTEPSEGDREEDEESEEEEEELPQGDVKPLYSGRDRRPPEPDEPPPRGEHRDTRDAGTGRSDHTKQSEKRRRSGGERTRSRGRDRTKRPRHRGGRKHQRLGRLAENPLLPVHRKPAASYWGLSTLCFGKEQLDRPLL